MSKELVKRACFIRDKTMNDAGMKNGMSKTHEILDRELEQRKNRRRGRAEENKQG